MEEMVSRIPSLFAYCEFDSIDIFRVHKATDAIDGSYGKITCGIKAPYNLTCDGVVLFSTNECVSYRTLMNYYYKAKSEGFKANGQNTLIRFVETAIGLVRIEIKEVIVRNDNGIYTEVDEESETTCKKWKYEYSYNKSFIFDIEPTKIPETIYLSQAKKLYNEMVKLKKLCHEYQRELETTDVTAMKCWCRTSVNLALDSTIRRGVSSKTLSWTASRRFNASRELAATNLVSRLGSTGMPKFGLFSSRSHSQINEIKKRSLVICADRKSVV